MRIPERETRIITLSRSEQFLFGRVKRRSMLAFRVFNNDLFEILRFRTIFCWGFRIWRSSRLWRPDFPWRWPLVRRICNRRCSRGGQSNGARRRIGRRSGTEIRWDQPSSYSRSSGLRRVWPRTASFERGLLVRRLEGEISWGSVMTWRIWRWPYRQNIWKVL